MESIVADLKLIKAKKRSLRKAFETLQANSSSLSSFNLTWSDLESHFSSQISSLRSNFNILRCQQEPQFQRLASPNAAPVPSPARPELRSLCENMDGLGLKNYILERPSEITAIRAELQDALRCASDPAVLVLGAVEGFLHEPSLTGIEISKCDLWWSIVMLLEELAALKPEIGVEVKEKAKELSEEWKQKTSVTVEKSLACLGFLYLVAAYGLADCFDMSVLMEFTAVVAEDSKFEHAAKLCRLLGLNVPDLISKLKRTSKKLLAVKFIFEFKLTDKFPPVPILKKHVELSKKVSERDKKRKNCFLAMRAATRMEVRSLESVIKIIEEHNLESEYPKEELVKHIESVKKAAALQHSAQIPTSIPPQQANNTQDPSGSNHLKNQETCDKMMNSERVILPAFEHQQQLEAQEPSGSKRLKTDQSGDTTVASKGVTDESQQSAPVPASEPQQQSKPHEISGSKLPNAEQVGHEETQNGSQTCDKLTNSERVILPAFEHQQQSKAQEPSESKLLQSDQPCDTTVASKRVTDESQQSKPHELSGSNPPIAEQVSHEEIHSLSQHPKNQETRDELTNSKRVTCPASEPQQQSETQEPSGSKRLKTDQQSAQVPASEPRQQSKPHEPPNAAEQVGHQRLPNGTVAASSNFPAAFPQSHWQAAAGPAVRWPAAPSFSYVGSTAGPHSRGGPYPIAAAPNIGPPARLYGSSIGPFRIPPGNLRPHVYFRPPPPPAGGYFRSPQPPAAGYFTTLLNSHGIPPHYRR